MRKIPFPPALVFRQRALGTASTSLWPSRSTTVSCLQVRHATFIPRPRRPYTLTQLVCLSDGSTFTHRTTSPNPLYRSTKDTRNTLLWQPSEKSLQNVEHDEAGKLAAFRQRFGRGFDASLSRVNDHVEGDTGEAAAADTSFADLISGYAQPSDASVNKIAQKSAEKSDSNSASPKREN